MLLTPVCSLALTTLLRSIYMLLMHIQPAKGIPENRARLSSEYYQMCFPTLSVQFVLIQSKNSIKKQTKISKCTLSFPVSSSNSLPSCCLFGIRCCWHFKFRDTLAESIDFWGNCISIQTTQLTEVEFPIHRSPNHALCTSKGRESQLRIVISHRHPITPTLSQKNDLRSISTSTIFSKKSLGRGKSSWVPVAYQ